MNAVEIEQEISALALQPFDGDDFPFAFLGAFGNKVTALRRLRAGNNNAPDIRGGVRQRNHIHIAVCEPGATADDLFQTPLDQAEIDFENEGGETYVCGNPPYVGSTWQTAEQKADIRSVVNGRSSSPGFLDDVAGWFVKAVDWIAKTRGVAAFVSTHSICQGQSVPILWPIVFEAGRIDAVRERRLSSPDKGARTILAKRPHQLALMRIGRRHTIVVPIHSSERRSYLPVGLIDDRSTLTNATYGLYDATLWDLAIIVSGLRLVWIATVCGKLETRYRYSDTLGWNTFPVPLLTGQNKADLTRCAENLLAREVHFPATIADLHDPDTMPENLRQAHGHNDEVLERICIGRRFKNDTERLEKLFDLCTKMVAKPNGTEKAKTSPTTRGVSKVGA